MNDKAYWEAKRRKDREWEDDLKHCKNLEEALYEVFKRKDWHNPMIKFYAELKGKQWLRTMYEKWKGEA